VNRGKLTGKEYGEMISALEFDPTPEMQRVKARFMSLVSAQDLNLIGNISADAAAKILGDRRVRVWWDKEGFSGWFLNKNEYREKAEYLLTLAMDRAKDILQSGDARNVSAQVQILKLMLEMTGKMPREDSGKNKPAPALDPGQLDEMLKLNGYVKLEDARKMAIPMEVEVSGGEEEGEIH
jgi:hypothetical protein